MKKKLKKAFTLTELLVVVIVLGVLAAVAAPKFARVLETRKTAEAEEILASLRAEQEYRCVQGKAYQTDVTATQTMASAKNSKNYNYTLTGAGAAASSARGYSIQMPSYKNGQLCCEGAYCASLNKSYPSCSSLPAEDDECAADVTPEPAVCATSPEGKTVQRQDCGTGYIGKKVRRWNTETCAWGDWDETECYLAEVGSCEDSTYASAHPCECEPFSCECPTYAAAYPCECSGVCTCAENPKQAQCCTEDQYWNGASCVAKEYKWRLVDDCSGAVSDKLSDLNGNGAYCAMGNLPTCNASIKGESQTIHCGYSDDYGSFTGCSRWFNPDEIHEGGFSDVEPDFTGNCDWTQFEGGEWMDVEVVCSDTDVPCIGS